MHCRGLWLPSSIFRITQPLRQPQRLHSSYYGDTALGNKSPRAYFEQLTTQEKKVVDTQQFRLITQNLSHYTANLESVISHFCHSDPSRSLLQTVETRLTSAIARQDLQFFSQLEKVNSETLSSSQTLSLLMTLRRTVSTISKEFKLNPEIIESSGPLSPEFFREHIVQKNRLFLDFGLVGHGPLPHIVQNMMLSILESMGKITSVREVYQDLSRYSDDKRSVDFTNSSLNFAHVMDNIHSKTFNNPMVLMNYILDCHDLLPTLHCLAKVTQKHEGALSDAQETWRFHEDKLNLLGLPHYTNACIKICDQEMQTIIDRKNLTGLKATQTAIAILLHAGNSDIFDYNRGNQLKIAIQIHEHLSVLPYLKFTETI